MTTWTPNINWQRLFPPEPYRFSMGLRPGSAREFFAPSLEAAQVLAERRRWLAGETQHYAVLTDAGIPLFQEFETVTAHWRDHSSPARPTASPERSAARNLADLASALEPDIVLLVPDNDCQLRVVGGAVCFPSSWALTEKIGLTLAEVHAPVPTLNSQLATRIDAALSRLPPGACWLRENWGLAADAHLNRHPARGLDRLHAGVRLDGAWLRLEHQALFRLPETGGVVFGIRVTVHRLAELAADPAFRLGLAGALTSMSPEIAEYKGLTDARVTLAGELMEGPKQ